ncbi:MAG: PilN domain-containing protein [Proteobacteria bacterium]|nr:PilN domain-containing protein [Pseudomonadota bacterium]
MQQVNLYQAQFKPKQVILPAPQLLLLALLSVIIFIFLSIYMASHQASVASKLIAQTEQLQQQQHQLDTLQQQLDSRKINPLLVAELNDFRLQLKTKKILLDHLSNQSLGNKNGFSTMLTALSQQHIDDLWLTQFSILNSGQFIALQGSAYNSHLIPEYIDNLAKSEQFQGKHFSVFQLQKPDDSPYFNFKLHTSNSVKNKP